MKHNINIYMDVVFRNTFFSFLYKYFWISEYEQIFPENWWQSSSLRVYSYYNRAEPSSKVISSFYMCERP